MAVNLFSAEGRQVIIILGGMMILLRKAHAFHREAPGTAVFLCLHCRFRVSQVFHILFTSCQHK
ncbi:hypothetical protein CRM79_06415 [Pantoea agglomerans]|nr:hypothetical protein CRM79_06415 [Pantoea agglomerans]